MEQRLSISATSASCSRDKWSQYFPRVPAPVEAGPQKQAISCRWQLPQSSAALPDNWMRGGGRVARHWMLVGGNCTASSAAKRQRGGIELLKTVLVSLLWQSQSFASFETRIGTLLLLHVILIHSDWFDCCGRFWGCRAGSVHKWLQTTQLGQVDGN